MIRRLGAAIAALAAVLVGLVAVDEDPAGKQLERGIGLGLVVARVADPTPTPMPTPLPTPQPRPTATPQPTSTPEPVYAGWVDPETAGQPWGDTVAGLLTFRGSPTRSFYGIGPVPTAPVVQWSFPDRPMCSVTVIGEESEEWCGTGWTGQPAVWERDDGLWVAFGAYDRKVHFLDGVTGERRLPDFETGDIIKGSVTVDPDGYPLLYFGSRDNFLRVVSFDGNEPVELWALDARTIEPRLWNDDWDGAPLVIDDYLFEGGENSVFHVVKLNRGYDGDGMVTVDPELVVTQPGWDDELIAAFGPNVSIENSVAISGNTAYFANSGGLVQGWDIGGLTEGEEPTRTFRFWTGDDTDASVVIDEEGFLYVGVEYERPTARGREVGQLLKLDPSNPDDPLVWAVKDQGVVPAGLWATPAVHGDVVYASTNGGRLLGVDRATGEIRWEKFLPGPLWASQVVVDDVLIQGDCDGNVRAFDVSDTRVEPPELWSVAIGGCIESTPAVWDGRIWVGTRGGRFHMVADNAGG